MYKLLCRVCLYAVLTGFIHADASCIKYDDFIYPTKFTSSSHIPDAYARIDKTIVDKLNFFEREICYCVDPDTVKLKLAQFDSSLTQPSYNNFASLLQQQFAIVLPVFVENVRNYLIKKMPAKYQRIRQSDRRLISNISEIFLCLKFFDFFDFNNTSLINYIKNLDNLNNEEQWAIGYLSLLPDFEDITFINEQLETSLAGLFDSSTDLKKYSRISKELWHDVIEYIINSLSSIECQDVQGGVSQLWNMEDYIRGIANKLAIEEEDNSSLLSLLEIFRPMSVHPAQRYYQQSAEMSIGMAKAVCGIKASSDWQIIGQYIYTMMRQFPKRYITNIFTHWHLKMLLQDLIARYQINSSNIRVLIENYINHDRDNAQDVIVPLIALQSLLSEVSDLSAGEVRTQYPYSIMHNFLNKNTTMLLRMNPLEKFEVYQRNLIMKSAKQYTSPLFGTICNSALLILMKNLELRDRIFAKGADFQENFDLLFNNAVLMAKSLKIVDKPQYFERQDIMSEYKPILKSYVLDLHPNDFSFCRTAQHLKQIELIYKILSSVSRKLTPRILILTNPSTGQPRYKIIHTMAIDVKGNGQCWAYSLRTSGEPAVRKMITNLYDINLYKTLHTDSEGHYISDQAAYQILIDYIPYIKASAGTRILHEEMSSDTMTDEKRSDIIIDSPYSIRIATSNGPVRHYWTNANIGDIWDIAQIIRLYW